MTYSDSDTEAARDDRTPLLGRHTNGSSGTDLRKPASGFWNVWSPFVRFFSGGVYALDATTYGLVESLLNERDEEERDRLTERWRDNRLSELNFVGVVAALLAGVLTSTGSWPDVLPEDVTKPWLIRTAWYCGIVLSLFSILTAADQTVRLHRLSSHSDAWHRIRRLLSKRNGKSRGSRQAVRIQPNTLQMYTWQLPVIFLTAATVCMIVGMFLHVWSAVGEWVWKSETKMAVAFSVIALVSIIVFFAGQATLYMSDEED